MKILFFIDSLGSGGAQRQLVELAKVFKENGHTCQFLIYHDITFFKNELDKFNIEINLIQSKNYLHRIIKCKKFIRDGEYDVVISFLLIPNFINELSSFPSKKHKIIVGERSANNSILKSKRSKIIRWFHRYSDALICNSHANLQLIKKLNLPLTNEKVIYNIIDFSKWKVTTPNSDRPKLRILTAATVRDLKNPMVLIEAVSALTPEERKEVSIDWYGKDSFDGTFEKATEFIKQHKLQEIIRFHKPVKNLHQILDNYNIVGLYSKLEGLPNTVCEGMAAGKTIIASDVSDIPIILDSQKQFIFKSESAEDLTRVLRDLLYNCSSSDLIKIGRKNREFALEHFHKDKIYTEYLNIINN